MTTVAGDAVGVSASAALAGVLTGRPVGAVVLGAGRVACYLDVGHRVVVIEAAEGVGLPNAVRLRPETPAVSAQRGDTVMVGRGALRGPGWQLVVHRWWDPQIAVGRVDTDALATAARQLGATLRDGWPPTLRGCTRTLDLSSTANDLAQAVRTGGYHPIAAAGRALVGRGAGLTPAGDDVLAGLLATLRVLGPGSATPVRIGAATVADAVAAAVVDYAATHTTALSAQLLASAADGAVAQPVAAVLRAITREEGLSSAVGVLSRVGHTSGRDLLHGIAIAVDAMLSFSRTAPTLTED